MKLNSQSTWFKNMKLKKNRYKKRLEITIVNPPKPWPESWDMDNLIESRPKQIMKLNSQSIQCWIMKLRRKKSQLGKEKKNRVNCVNLLNSRFRTWL
jgi:hypothetical protein